MGKIDDDQKNELVRQWDDELAKKKDAERSASVARQAGESYTAGEDYDADSAQAAFYDSIYGAEPIQTGDALWGGLGLCPWRRIPDGAVLVFSSWLTICRGDRYVSTIAIPGPRIYRAFPKRYHVNPKAGWDGEKRVKGKPLLFQYPWEDEGYGRDYLKVRFDHDEDEDGTALCPKEVCRVCGVAGPFVANHRLVCEACHGSRGRCKTCGHIQAGVPDRKARNLFAVKNFKPSSGSVEEQDFLETWAHPTMLERTWRASGNRSGPPVRGETDIHLARERFDAHCNGYAPEQIRELSRPGPHKGDGAIHLARDIAIVALNIEGFNNKAIAEVANCSVSSVQRAVRRFKDQAP
jgi:hypothetical protein